MERRKRSRVPVAHAHPPGKNINITTSELPSDIVFFHILPWLPVKSLSRFKCVSKRWHSFLTTPDFRKMHIHHHHHHVTSTKKIIALSDKIPNNKTPYKFRTIDCERPKDDFTAGHFLPFKVGPLEEVQILTSMHGLVCIGITARVGSRADKGMRNIYTDLILWNPATGDHKTLCKPIYRDREDCYSSVESLFGLYYTPWDDDYKLLRVTHRPKVYIYSLKSDSWRKVESDFQRPNREYLSARSSSYYWVPSTTDHLSDDDEYLYFFEDTLFERSYSIMRFNKKTETLKLMAIPFLGRNQSTTCLSFRVLRDGRSIELWVNIEYSPRLPQNELWRMDSDGYWTKVEDSGMRLSDPFRYEEYHCLHLTRNGNKLVMYDGINVYQLDLKTHTIESFSYASEYMPVVYPGGKYIETMVSPNQYISST